MASLAETYTVTSTAKTVTSPSNAPGTEYTKLNILNRRVPKEAHEVLLPDVWIKTSATATVGGSGCVQVPPNIPVEIPFSASLSVITEWGSARINIVGVA